MKNARGFEIQYFKDDYDVECSIQESSSVEPHLWLGVHSPEIKMMTQDFLKEPDICSKIQVVSDNPEQPNVGWMRIELPEEMCLFSRMHLNRKQAKDLASKLNYFAKHGTLKEE